jgi:hypothetical protein
VLILCYRNSLKQHWSRNVAVVYFISEYCTTRHTLSTAGLRLFILFEVSNWNKDLRIMLHLYPSVTACCITCRRAMYPPQSTAPFYSCPCNVSA